MAKLTVSAAPHIHSGASTNRIMLDVVLALLPATVASVVIFGLKSLCVLVPAVFILGSWAAFKFVWNITPEKRAEMAARKAAKVEQAENA